jgi:hypothetical protein
MLLIPSDVAPAVETGASTPQVATPGPSSHSRPHSRSHSYSRPHSQSRDRSPHSHSGTSSHNQSRGRSPHRNRHHRRSRDSITSRSHSRSNSRSHSHSGARSHSSSHGRTHPRDRYHNRSHQHKTWRKHSPSPSQSCSLSGSRGFPPNSPHHCSLSRGEDGGEVLQGNGRDKEPGERVQDGLDRVLDSAPVLSHSQTGGTHSVAGQSIGSIDAAGNSTSVLIPQPLDQVDKSNWPKWIAEPYSMFTRKDFGSRWISSVIGWTEIERKYGFVSPVGPCNLSVCRRIFFFFLT